MTTKINGELIRQNQFKGGAVSLIDEQFSLQSVIYFIHLLIFIMFTCYVSNHFVRGQLTH